MARRRFVSPAAWALARVAGVENPEQAMHLLVAQLLEEAEQTSPPTNLPLVASFQNIAGVDEATVLGAALIVRMGTAFRVVVNRDDTRERKRFSVAHEICHTLFPHFLGVTALADADVGVFSKTSEEEWLCDIGASHLLLPPGLVYEVALATPHDIEGLARIAGTFGASLEATGIALAELNIWPCGVVVFEEMAEAADEPSGNGDRALKTQAVCLPSDLKRRFFIPLKRPVRTDGPVFGALSVGGPTQGVEVIDTAKGPARFRTTALCQSFTHNAAVRRRVVAVVHPLE